MTNKQLKYNQAVLAALRELNQATAERLMRQGQHLGWWDSVRYWHSRQIPASQAAALLLGQASGTDG